MAGCNKELGFPKSGSVSSLREQKARTTLQNVRSKGHVYIELREDNKKPIFFCVLCLSPCYNDTVLNDHLRGRLHKKMYEAAECTLLKPNSWPFNDGMLFFHTPSNDNDHMSTSNPTIISNLLDNPSIDNSSLEIVPVESHDSVHDLASEGSPSSVDENSHGLIIPDVLLKDRVSDLEVRSIGVGKISVRYYQKYGVKKGIGRIWCEWLGDFHPNESDQNNIISQHDFAIVSFAFNYDLGRKGLLDDIFLPSSYTKPTLEENRERKRKRSKSFSDPEDVSESLSNEYGHNSTQLGLILSRSVRKELRIRRRLASKRVCNICQHKMLPGKDVATLINMKTGRIVCSSRNLNGAFHVYHISCLIHWVLLCDYEVYSKELVGSKVKKRCRRKKGAKVIEAEKEVKKQIYSAFCPECQGTGIDIDGDELEKPTVSLSEMYKHKMKACNGLREYMKHPEMLQNCSTGFSFSPQSEETMQENVSPLKMLRFYHADE